MVTRRSYYTVLTEAVNDMTTKGFDSAERLEYWQQQLRQAAEASLVSVQQMETDLKGAMAATYKRLIGSGGIARMHQGVSRFTIEQVEPQLRRELQRRIMASAQLIRLNRTQAIDKTLQRFSGWATSIPPGGRKKVDKVKEKDDIRKSLASLPFHERRVIIDQGHKLTANLNEIIASDGGAIAIIWHSNYRQKNYDYREDHKERDGLVYLLNDSWARTAGLVRPGPDGLYNDITHVAEEPFCRCYGTYIYHLRNLPEDMLTAKGQDELKRVRALIAAA